MKHRQSKEVALIAATALLLIASYFAAYLALSDPQPTFAIWQGSSPVKFARVQRFRVGNDVAAVIFSPLTMVDQAVRPDYWKPPHRDFLGDRP